MKIPVTSLPLRFVLVGAVLSIAVLLPADGKAQGTEPLKDRPQSAAESKISAVPAAAPQQRSRPSPDFLDVSGKILAGLGIVSGISASAWNLYSLRALRKDARKRLKALDDRVSSLSTQLTALNGRHEKTTDELKRGVDANTEEARSKFSEQRATLVALAHELKTFRQENVDRNPIRDQTLTVLPTEPMLVNSPIPPPLPPSTAAEVVAAYTSAMLSNDRERLRGMISMELNITQESEELLTRGTSVFNTQLQRVSGGGSYLLIQWGSKNWICPTARTLSSFKTNKPQKGIFLYESSASVSQAELKMPAETYEIHNGVWEVITKGIVLIPA